MMKNLKNELEAVTDQIKTTTDQLATANTRDGEVLNTIESQRLRIDKLQQAHDLKERQFIEGTVTLEQLQYSQQEIDSELKSLLNLERLAESTKKAIKELEKQLAAMNQQLKIARSEFCISRRNAIFNEIQNDQKLKAKLLEALAAFAVNGHVPYTNHWQTFINQFAVQILPVASQMEIDGAIELFKKSNSLD